MASKKKGGDLVTWAARPDDAKKAPAILANKMSGEAHALSTARTKEHHTLDHADDSVKGLLAIGNAHSIAADAAHEAHNAGLRDENHEAKAAEHTQISRTAFKNARNVADMKSQEANNDGTDRRLSMPNFERGVPRAIEGHQAAIAVQKIVAAEHPNREAQASAKKQIEGHTASIERIRDEHGRFAPK